MMELAQEEQPALLAAQTVANKLLQERRDLRGDAEAHKTASAKPPPGFQAPSRGASRAMQPPCPLAGEGWAMG